MEEQKQNGADQVIGSLQKDFKIVGAHRVHSWYAWAIVGIVFGMALGIIYVANRSGRVVMSEAAQKQSNLAVIGAIQSYLPISAHTKNPQMWIGAAPLPYTTTSYVSAPLTTPTNEKISRFLKSSQSGLNVIGLAGTKLYYGSRASNNSYVIDATKAPSADASKLVTYRFNGIYQQDDGNAKTKLKPIDVGVMIEIKCGAIIPDTRCDRTDLIFSSYRGKAPAPVEQAYIEVPNGISFYTSKVMFMLPGEKIRTVNKAIVLPAGGGTHTFIFRKNKNTGKFYIHKLVIGPSDTGPEIELPDNSDDGEGGGDGGTSTSTPPTTNIGGLIVATLSPNTPPAQSLAMGTPGNSLLRMRILNSSSTPALVSKIVVTDEVTNNASGTTSFDLLSLYHGSTRIMSASPIISASGVITTSFYLSSPLSFSPYESKDLLITGNLSSYASGNGSSGSTHSFCVDPTNGGIAGPLVVSGTKFCGAPQSIYRGTLSVSATQAPGATQSKMRLANDYIGAIRFRNYETTTQLQSLTLTFTGSALAQANSFTVSLIDYDSGGPLGSATSQTCAPNNSTCTVTFNPNYSVSTYTDKLAKVIVNSSAFTNNTATTEGLSVTIQNTGDLLWSDNTTNNVPLNASEVPINIATVSYE